MAPRAARESNAHQSWADLYDEQDDFVYETDADVDSPLGIVSTKPVVANCDGYSEQELTGHSARAEGAASGLPSIGSSRHQMGTCKPCAFFHTRGCQNGKSCVFCHLCPPHEKQRRRRQQRLMYEKLGQQYQSRALGDQSPQGFKPGHSRQGSLSSVGTCSTKFSHSRQSSLQSDASRDFTSMEDWQGSHQVESPVYSASARTLELSQALQCPAQGGLGMWPDTTAGGNVASEMSAAWPCTGVVLVPVPMPVQVQQQQMQHSGEPLVQYVYPVQDVYPVQALASPTSCN